MGSTSPGNLMGNKIFLIIRGPKDLGQGTVVYCYLWSILYGYYGQTQIRKGSCSGEASRHSGDRKGLSHSEGLEHSPSQGHKIRTWKQLLLVCWSVMTHYPLVMYRRSSNNRPSILPQAEFISLHTKTFSPPWPLRICWGLLYLPLLNWAMIALSQS